MPKYIPAQTPVPIDTFDVPSTPDGHIWGIAKIRHGISKGIDMASTRMDPVLGEYQQSTAFEDAMLRTWLAHPKTGTDLQNGDGSPLDLTNPATLDELMDPDDVAALSLWLTERLYPALYERLMIAQNALRGESADPNGEQPATSSESGADETTNASDGSSPTPTEPAASES